MKSLSNLNSFANQNLILTDNRPAGVVFDRSRAVNQYFTLTTNSKVLPAGIDIVEIANYETADTRYRLSIKTSQINPLTNTSIEFPSLPSGVGVTNLVNYATVTGDIKTSSTKKVFGTSSISSNLGKAVISGFPTIAQNAEFTVEFWVNFNNTSGTQTILQLGLDSFPNRWKIYTDNGFLITDMLNTEYGDIQSYTQLQPNQWYHIAFVRYQGIGRLYINGSKFGTSADAGSSSFGNSSHLEFGNIDGFIDEVRISSIKRYPEGIPPLTGPDTWTVPTSPFSIDNYTLFLSHCDGAPNSKIIRWGDLNSGSLNYEVYGIKNIEDWNAIKNPTWLLPANYSTYKSFYVEARVIYYDGEDLTDVNQTCDLYDPVYYPLSQMTSAWTLTPNVNGIFTSGANMQAMYSILETSLALNPGNANLTFAATLFLETFPIKGFEAALQPITTISPTPRRLAGLTSNQTAVSTIQATVGFKRFFASLMQAEFGGFYFAGGVAYIVQPSRTRPFTINMTSQFTTSVVGEDARLMSAMVMSAGTMTTDATKFFGLNDTLSSIFNLNLPNGGDIEGGRALVTAISTVDTNAIKTARPQLSNLPAISSVSVIARQTEKIDSVTSRLYQGLDSDASGNLYAGTPGPLSGGNIFYWNQSGDFVSLNQTSLYWRSVAVAPNGDVYAVTQPDYQTDDAGLYKRTFGQNTFVKIQDQVSNGSSVCVDKITGNVFYSMGRFIYQLGVGLVYTDPITSQIIQDMDAKDGYLYWVGQGGRIKRNVTQYDYTSYYEINDTGLTNTWGSCTLGNDGYLYVSSTTIYKILPTANNNQIITVTNFTRGWGALTTTPDGIVYAVVSDTNATNGGLYLVAYSDS